MNETQVGCPLRSPAEDGDCEIILASEAGRLQDSGVKHATSGYIVHQEA